MSSSLCLSYSLFTTSEQICNTFYLPKMKVKKMSFLNVYVDERLYKFIQQIFIRDLQVLCLLLAI